MPNPTRFTATVHSRSHLGHLWCAFVNWAMGDVKGILFRAEDIAARATSAQATDPMVEDSIEDFTTQLPRHGVPIVAVLRQSLRRERYDELNRQFFNWRLRWSYTHWQAYFSDPLNRWGGNWESPRMAILSRVADDHDFGVRNVVMGVELYDQGRIYLDYWDACFGHEGEQARPKLLFIPEVMAGDALVNGHFEKISKSVCRNFFLSQLNLDPVATLFGLAERQLKPTLWSGPLLDVPKTILDLRTWVSKARWDGASWLVEPEPVTREDLEAWS